jgi:hypothetical protein
MPRRDASVKIIFQRSGKRTVQRAQAQWAKRIMERFNFLEHRNGPGMATSNSGRIGKTFVTHWSEITRLAQMEVFA